MSWTRGGSGHPEGRCTGADARAGDNARVLPPLSDLQTRVEQMLQLWRVPPGPPVPVAWNGRLRTTAGRAFLEEGRIELNPELLSRAPAHIDRVLVHEAAHIAARRLFGPGCPAHGRHWRGLMRLAGLPPDVTHNLPVPRRRQRSARIYLRVCSACGQRRIARAVRYDACACGAAAQFLVVRAPATQRGLEALRGMPLPEVRQLCEGR